MVVLCIASDEVEREYFSKFQKALNLTSKDKLKEMPTSSLGISVSQLLVELKSGLATMLVEMLFFSSSRIFLIFNFLMFYSLLQNHLNVILWFLNGILQPQIVRIVLIQKYSAKDVFLLEKLPKKCMLNLLGNCCWFKLLDYLVRVLVLIACFCYYFKRQKKS